MKPLLRHLMYVWLWSTPATQIAVVLGISDTMLGKYAKQYHIPRPWRGYWTQLKAGGASSWTPLTDPADIRALPLQVDDTMFTLLQQMAAEHFALNGQSQASGPEGASPDPGRPSSDPPRGSVTAKSSASGTARRPAEAGAPSSTPDQGRRAPASTGGAASAKGEGAAVPSQGGLIAPTAFSASSVSSASTGPAAASAPSAPAGNGSAGRDPWPPRSSAITAGTSAAAPQYHAPATSPQDAWPTPPTPPTPAPAPAPAPSSPAPVTAGAGAAAPAWLRAASRRLGRELGRESGRELGYALGGESTAADLTAPHEAAPAPPLSDPHARAVGAQPSGRDNVAGRECEGEGEARIATHASADPVSSAPSWSAVEGSDGIDGADAQGRGLAGLSIAELLALGAQYGAVLDARRMLDALDSLAGAEARPTQAAIRALTAQLRRELVAQEPARALLARWRAGGKIPR